MTCDQMPPLLEAFTDGELGWEMTWRVRRHLATCPACASELAEVRQLTARVRAWRDVPAPARLRSRLTAALPSAPPASVPLRPALARRAAVGLAGVAAAVAAFVWLLPGQPGRPTIAYADVVEAMAHVKTAHWTETVTWYREDGQPRKPDVGDGWLRWNPLAMARGSNVGPVSGFQYILDNQGEHMYDPVGRKATLRWLGYKSGGHFVRTAITDPSMRQFMLNYILPPHGWDDPSQSDKLKGRSSLGQFVLWQVRAITVDGRSLVELHSEFRPMPGQKNVGEGSRETYWIDPDTHLLERHEQQVINPKTQQTEMVIVDDHFQYDQIPPQGTFELHLPPGVKVQDRRASEK